MPYEFNPNNELSPETQDILKIILEDTNGLRRVELGDVPPATVLEDE